MGTRFSKRAIKEAWRKTPILERKELVIAIISASLCYIVLPQKSAVSEITAVFIGAICGPIIWIILQFLWHWLHHAPIDRIPFKMTSKGRGIEWSEFDHALNHCASVPHQMAFVSHFALNGINTTNKPLYIKDVYIQSLINGETLSAVIGWLDFVDAKGATIHPKMTFKVNVDFPDESTRLTNGELGGGMTFDSFMARFSSFAFVFETNKGTYRFEYDGNATRKWMQEILGMWQPRPRQKSPVLPANRGEM